MALQQRADLLWANISANKISLNQPSAQCEPCIQQPAQQAFLYGSGEKNEERESKTARKMAQVKEHFMALVSSVSRGQNRKSLPRYFFAPKPNGNACYAGYAFSFVSFYTSSDVWLHHVFNQRSGNRNQSVIFTCCVDLCVQTVFHIHNMLSVRKHIRLVLKPC